MIITLKRWAELAAECSPRIGADMSNMSRERRDPGKMKKPEKGGTPKKITTPGKAGDSGPGGAHPGRNRPPMPKTKSAGENGMGSGKGE
jgi:hypothetical protein